MSKTMNDQAKYQRERADRLQSEVADLKSHTDNLSDDLLTLAQERQVLRAEVARLREALTKATAFIDSHVADPDITDEMITNYHAYQDAIKALEGE